MLKIIIFVLMIILALDGIFREGLLLEAFLSREMHIPFFVRVAYIAIAIIATALLFHAIIWEFNLMPKPEETKTALQLKQEEEDEARRIATEEDEAEIAKVQEEEEERIKAEESKEKIRKQTEEMAKRQEEENAGRKYLL